MILALCVPCLVGCTAPADQVGGNPTPKPSAQSDLDRQVELATGEYNACMGEAGWVAQEVPAVNDPTKTQLGYSYTEEQAEQFQASNDACIDESGLATIVPAPSEADLHAGYRSIRNMRKCLVDAGFEIPEPPSEQSYIEDDGAWTPYDYIVGMTDFQKAEKACPQNGF